MLDFVSGVGKTSRHFISIIYIYIYIYLDDGNVAYKFYTICGATTVGKSFQVEIAVSRYRSWYASANDRKMVKAKKKEKKKEIWRETWGVC